MSVRIQFRRGTAAEWTAANPTLAEGELAIELDTGYFKIGDGTTAWTSLGYPISTTAIQESFFDAKGDLLVGTADDTVARLPVGSNGLILTANSATSSGVEWSENTAASTGKAIAMAFVFG